MRTQFTFLTAGDSYEAELPDGTDPDPDVSGAFVYGELPRPLIYEPDSRRINPAEDAALVHVVGGKVNGSSVAVYRATETPSTVIAFWRVAGGYVHTYMDDLVALPAGCKSPDLTRLLEAVVRAVSVSDARFGPFAALAPPLRRADPRDTLARDKVRFGLPAGTSPGVATLEFRREPGWSREGTSVRNDVAVTEIRITTAAQIAVSAFGPPDHANELEHHAATAATSLSPL